MPQVGIILAAGRGSRLSPLTDTLPKPLVTLGGRSLLEINLDRLYNLVDSFAIVINWLGQQIIDQIGSTYRNKKVKYIWQKSPKGGTLSAFLETAPYFPGSSFIVSISDSYLDPSFYKSLQSAIQNNRKQAYLLAKKIEDKESLKQFGVFRVDQDNQFLELVEKPEEYVSNLINLGIYYFPPHIKNYFKFRFKKHEEELYITDLINLFASQNPVKIISSSAYYLTISSLSDLEKAQSDFENHQLT